MYEIFSNPINSSGIYVLILKQHFADLFLISFCSWIASFIVNKTQERMYAI